MPKSGRRAKEISTLTARAEQDRKVDMLDRLSQFDWFEQTILPAIREDLQAGTPAEALRAKYQAVVQACLISTAIADSDPKNRIAASKDVLDRSEGKAKERVEQTHKFESLDEDQLTAILKSKLAKASEEDEYRH